MFVSVKFDCSVLLSDRRSVKESRGENWLAARDLREGEVKFLCLAVRKCVGWGELYSL